MSFFHLSRVLNYINVGDLNLFTVKDTSIFESLEIDWDILDEFLKEKKIKNIQIFFNVLYLYIY